MKAENASPHARACQDELLRRLRLEGHEVGSVDEAIRRGLLTDTDWCTELSRYRELYGVGRGRVEE